MLLTGLMAACNFSSISPDEALRQTQIRETELDVHVKQTLLVQQQSAREGQRTAEAATSEAQALVPTSPLPAPPTSPVAPTEPVTAPPEDTEIIPESNETPEPFDEAGFKTWRNGAQILLYEDMTARLDTVRYVKSSLDKMGLSYKDDGSAFGWLLDDLKNGPPEGDQWDLIILAAEDKAGIKADFFAPALQAINQGTSVILEVWYLDNTYRSSAAGLLQQCGLEFQNNWIRIPPSQAALFAVAPDHPIFQRPNSGMGFSSTTQFWWDPQGNISYDIGDLVKRTPDSTATLLLGTMSGERNTHGMAAICMNDQLILQTFSSHILNFNVMALLWENYIDYALRTRFNQIQ